MGERILLSSPHMSDEGYEMQYIQEAFDLNWIAPLGKNVTEFENELAEMAGAGHGVALSSGTAAIHLALKAAGVGAGDIVLVQDLTFAATVNPVLYENATPVFIDSEVDSWNMDPESLEAAFEKYTPKAVMVVHLYGISARIEEIRAICKKHNVALIEDAAESLGTTLNGQWSGTFGDYGIYSFNGNKIITTSGGGMLVSKNKEAIDKAHYWATQARENVAHYEHTDIGYNYRLSNISAGIGRGQLKVLEQRVEQKRHIFYSYKEGLGDIDGVSFIEERDGERSNYWLTPILLAPELANPEDLFEYLQSVNIDSRPMWKPMHMQPVYKDYDFVSVNKPVSRKYFEEGLVLPSDSKMTDEDIARVIKEIRTFLKK